VEVTTNPPTTLPEAPYTAPVTPVPPSTPYEP
jgi:hypothetical protein